MSSLSIYQTGPLGRIGQACPTDKIRNDRVILSVMSALLTGLKNNPANLVGYIGILRPPFLYSSLSMSDDKNYVGTIRAAVNECQ